MKNLIVISFLLIALHGFGQDKSLPLPEAYFSAIIVNDIDTSINWYKQHLDFNVIHRFQSEDNEFRQASIVCGNILIELIEIKSSVTADELLKNKPKRTMIDGFFKIGFLVDEFDAWVNRLREAEVEIHGRVVTDKNLGKRMLIIKDPDGNRIQLFEK